MAYLISTTEIYRVDTEVEAAELINEAKKDPNFILSKYSTTKNKKERKSKGDIVDEWYNVSLVKKFDDEKRTRRLLSES